MNDFTVYLGKRKTAGGYIWKYQKGGDGLLMMQK